MPLGEGRAALRLPGHQLKLNFIRPTFNSALDAQAPVRPLPKRTQWMMNIPDPKLQTSGFNAKFALFSLIFICLPLLEIAIHAASGPSVSRASSVAWWICSFVISCGGLYLLREFVVQLHHWLRGRFGHRP